MKCQKKATKFSVIFTLISVLLFTITYLVYAGSDIGIGDNKDYDVGTSTGQSYKYSSSWPDGTNYSITIDGVSYPISIDMADGTKGSGGMNGYGLGGNYGAYTQNPLPTGEINISAEDIAAVLRQYGYNDAADAIDNGAGYDMYAEQYATIYNPTTGKYQTMTYSQFENWYNNLSADEQKRVRNELGAFFDPFNAWSDEQDTDLDKGWYWRDDGTVIPPPGDTNDPDDPTPTVSREWGETWSSANAASCGSASATLNIENSHFGVAAGNPIPTSESLSFVGDTTALGEIYDVQDWTYTVYSGKATVYYSWGYMQNTWTETWKPPEKNASGEITKSGEWVSSTTSVQVEKIGATWDREHSKRWYSNDVPINSATYYPSWTSASYDYLYTGYAKFDQGAVIQATNETINGTKAIDVDGGGRIQKKDKDSPYRGAIATKEYTAGWQTGNSATAKATAISIAEGIGADHYITQPTDGELLLQYSGSTHSYKGNCVASTDDFGKGPVSFNRVVINEIPKIINKSVGTEYPTTDAKCIVGSNIYPISGVNGVKVHTPIFNELKVEPSGKNQLENLNLAKDSNSVQLPIVTLGDTAKITVNIKGRVREKDSYYYAENVNSKKVGDSSGYPLSKYVTEVRLECGLCGKEYVYEKGGINTFDEWTSNKDSFIHNCVVKEDRKDNTLHSVKSIVKAENIISAVAPDKQTSLEYNKPDNEYIVERTGGVYIAGKMYDLEVRATDDPGWKDFAGKAVQMLNKLPVGEKGDNAASAYKYGIKLGYRAYFDLKTLSTATGNIKITPKIYYVDLNGNVIDNVDIYYKNSPTTYKKLSDNDITINMSMNTTYGEKYNTVYNEEKTKTLSLMNRAINYAKMDNIGGLKNITLDSTGATANALMTKFNGAYQTVVYSMVGGVLTSETNYTNSRRWYGEVYMPATTVVAKSGAKVEEVARGVNTYKNGYLLIAFDKIETTLADGTTQYLKYSTANNPSGVENRPYILINEKAGKGKTVPITLPNGKQINIAGLGTDFYETSAPIIIYDVSLRANNDYEASGTH